MRRALSLMLPSATPGVLLECRLYLPSQLTPPSTSSDEIKPLVRALGLRKLVTAAHPWGRLGGNQDFPVVANHLPAAVGPDTAVLTFNARGIGKSEGSQPWPGAYPGNDHLDFAAVEEAGRDLTGAEKIYRLGYSYGTIPALNAPISTPLGGVMLVSPAPTLFKALTALGGPTFAQGLDATLAATSVVCIFGTSDDFTGASTLRSLGGDRVKKIEVEGGGHFYARREDGEQLRAAITEWINDQRQ